MLRADSSRVLAPPFIVRGLGGGRADLWSPVRSGPYKVRTGRPFHEEGAPGTRRVPQLYFLDGICVYRAERKAD